MYNDFYVKYNFTKDDINLLQRKLSYCTISEKNFLINYPGCIKELRKIYSYKDYEENNLFKRLEKAKKNNIKVKCCS